MLTGGLITGGLSGHTHRCTGRQGALAALPRANTEAGVVLVGSAGWDTAFQWRGGEVGCVRGQRWQQDGVSLDVGGSGCLL